MEDAPNEVPKTPETQEQVAMTVSPEMLLAQIVTHVGEEFVIIPTEGWMQIVATVNNFKPTEERSLIEELESLGVPVVPVSLAKKDEEEDESPIIMPNDTPEGESRIIMPDSDHDGEVNIIMP